MFNRSSIEEANRHLQALHGRVSELEHVIAKQNDALLSKDSLIKSKVTELSKQDILITDLRQEIIRQDQKAEQTDKDITSLKSKVDSLSAELVSAQRKNEALANIINVIPELKSLIMRIEDIAISVDDTNVNYQANECTSTRASSVADGDNTDVIVTGKAINPLKTNSISEMAKEFSMQNEKLKKFSISEDEDEMKVHEKTISNESNNQTQLKEYYF